TVESGESEDYSGPPYGPQEGEAQETTRSSEGAPDQQEGEEGQGETQQGGQQQGGGGPLDQVQDTVGGLTGGLTGGQQQGGGGPLDQVQDTVGGLTGGLL